MNVATNVARLLLGALFVFAGAAGLLMTPPPQPGLAGQFTTVVYASHFMDFVSVAQLVLGLLLLVNRFVPVALIMLAAFIYNSFAFHVTMALPGVVAPIVVGALGLLVARKYRTIFAPLFLAKPETDSPASGGSPVAHVAG